MKTETACTWILSFVAVVLAAMIAARVTMVYGGRDEAVAGPAGTTVLR